MIKWQTATAQVTLHLIRRRHILCSHLDICCKIIPMSDTTKANSMAVTAKENRRGSVRRTQSHIKEGREKTMAELNYL